MERNQAAEYGKGLQDHAGNLLPEVDVFIAGLFSANVRQHEAIMDATAALATARGARVVGRVVQRRGVSHGGVATMTWPYSRQTLFGAGKVRELADRCRAERVGAVVVVNALTEHQRLILEERLGCAVLSRADLEQP